MSETLTNSSQRLDEIEVISPVQPLAYQADNQYYYVKRFMDVLLTAVAIILLAPLLLLVAVLIKLDSRGSVLFVQERIGSKRQTKNGHSVWKIHKFRIYKFRSMYQNADETLHRTYIQAFVQGTVEKSDASNALFKLTNDPRVTRVGALLRKWSLDELPQFFNVLRGEMSLVGPRPVPEYEVAEYRESWHYGRLATLPGITGLWQVKGRCQVEFEDMIRMDLDYIQEQSLWLDIKILFQTIPAVLSGLGAE